jgi:hypothetical protein
MTGADTGFFAIVLVRPIATTVLRTANVPYDKDMLLFASELEEVKNDAYLSLLALSQSSLSSATIRGAIKTVWTN